MAAPGPFGVIGVNHPVFEGGDGVFYKARLVEGVGVDGHLHVVFISHPQAGVDGSGGGAPVFVQLQAHGPSFDLLCQGFGLGAVAFAEKPEVHRESVGGLQHAPDIPRAGSAGGGVGARGGAGAAADHSGDARGDRRLDLLRTNEVNMAVDAPGGDDHSFPGHHLGAGANDDIHIVLNVGVARLANGVDFAVFDADVGLDNAPPVENQGVGNHQVYRPGVAPDRRLTHAVADHLAAAKFHLIPVGGEVLLDFNN